MKKNLPAPFFSLNGWSILLILLILFSSCQQRYAHVKKVRVKKEPIEQCNGERPEKETSPQLIQQEKDSSVRSAEKPMGIVTKPEPARQESENKTLPPRYKSPNTKGFIQPLDSNDKKTEPVARQADDPEPIDFFNVVM